MPIAFYLARQTGWRIAWEPHFVGVAVLVLLLTLDGGVPARRALAQESNESHVKAAFVFNFVKFVEWPSGAFEDDGTPIIVGVVGEDPSNSAIEQAISGKAANGRRLLIRRFPNFKAITRCHILFVSSTQRDNLRQILAVVGPAVLTVGETGEFGQMGGIINFTIVDKKVRFEINQTAAEKAGLRISAKLLRLARAVR